MSEVIFVEDLAAECAAMARQLESGSLAETLQDDVLPIIREGFADNFNRAEDSEGGAWPPRKEPGNGHPLLRDTLALLGATQGDAGSVTDITDRELGAGVDKGVELGGIPGAAVHNFGYPPRNIPQREFLYASSDALDRACEALADGALTVFFVHS